MWGSSAARFFRSHSWRGLVGVGGCDTLAQLFPAFLGFGVMHHHFNGSTLSHGSLTSGHIAITSFLRVTGCPLFAAAPGEKVQRQADQQRRINTKHLGLGSVVHKTFYAGFIDREDLLQKNHGRFFKSRVGIHQHMGGLVFLLFRPGCHGCYDQCRRMTVSNVVLQNHHRTFSALFRADMRLHVCIPAVHRYLQPCRRAAKNATYFLL